MPEPSPFGPARRDQPGAVREIAEVAAGQYGVISRAQLIDRGVSRSTIARWADAGRVHPVHPAVFAVGHSRLSPTGRLHAALLYAGGRAGLSHQTAAWWWGLIDTAPRVIHVATDHKRRSLDAVWVHRPRDLDLVQHNGLPVTSVARTLLDLAATMSFNAVRRAFAEASRLGRVDPAAIIAELGRGRKGSSRLRKVIQIYIPELTNTISEPEELFVLLLVKHEMPMPEVNRFVEGYKVDCVWRGDRVVVELDSASFHGDPVAVEVDHARDLGLRRAGYRVRRYTWLQIVSRPDDVLADLSAALDLRTTN